MVSIVCIAPGQRVRDTTQTHLYTEAHAQSFGETQTNAPCARVNFCSAPLRQEEEEDSLEVCGKIGLKHDARYTYTSLRMGYGTLHKYELCVNYECTYAVITIRDRIVMGKSQPHSVRI